ncbi:MAG: alpha/beta fold hydrolase [Deltaproteobacteria bacterium]|nr:alpha/beta fold hydrolase [Deltaproteobacteria bacterium]
MNLPLADVPPPPTGLLETLAASPDGSALRWALLAAVLLLVLALMTWAHVRFWRRRLHVPLDYDDVQRLDTPDGSAIELRRLRPRGEATSEAGEPARPVLIIHGLAINERNCDAHPDRSFARHLAAAGRDVWLVTLRSGRNDHAPGERSRVRFAAMARHDVPLAVQAVRAQTGAAKIDLCGFSMGGMLLYATLGRVVPVDAVGKVVIFGSPARLGVPVWPLSKVKGLPDALAPMMPYRFLSALYAPFVDWFSTPFHRIVYNPDGVARGLTGSVMVDAMRDVPRPLHREFAAWAMGDGELRVDGARAIDGLRGLTLPVRFFAGAADGLAPPRSLRPAFEAWGADAAGAEGGQPDKAFVVLGRATGCGHDYGHGDMMYAERAPAEVFEPARRFLDGEAG